MKIIGAIRLGGRMSEKQEKIQRLRELNKNIYLFNYFRSYENHVEIPYNVGRIMFRIKK